MRPLLVLPSAALAWLVACGVSENDQRVEPELIGGSVGRDASRTEPKPKKDGAPGEADAGNPDDRDCAGLLVTVNEIAAGSVSTGTDIELEGVIATSQKFLVAKSSNGSCLWGVFVSADVDATAEHTGLMVVGYGSSSEANDRGELEPCSPGTDALPDDVALGDLLSIRGKTEVYQPSWCENATLAGQVRVRARATCPVSKLGSAEPPEPLAIDAETASALARGSDASQPALQAAVVRLSGVSGKQDGMQPDIVGAYGTIQLNETELLVRDKIAFTGLTQPPGGLGKSLEFGYPTSFSRIDGLVFLDYCDWVLAPRDKCQDFDPPSADCP
jgi:hypothetical protein